MIKDLMNAKSTKESLNILLVFFILVLVSTFLLRFLWNESLVKHITVFKPVKSLFDAFLLSLSLGVLKCC